MNIDDYQAKKEIATKKLAQTLSKQLAKTDIQLCGYANRTIVKRGSTMTAKGTSLYINGKGPAFLIGSFEAHKYV